MGLKMEKMETWRLCWTCKICGHENDWFIRPAMDPSQLLGAEVHQSSLLHVIGTTRSCLPLARRTNVRKKLAATLQTCFHPEGKSWRRSWPRSWLHCLRFPRRLAAPLVVRGCKKPSAMARGGIARWTKLLGLEWNLKLWRAPSRLYRRKKKDKLCKTW